MLNKERQAETKVDSSTTAEVSTSSPNAAKPNVGGSFCVATLIDSNSGQWWCKLLGVTFQVLSIRNETVVVKSCADEGYQTPYNFHELPKEAVKIEFI